MPPNSKIKIKNHINTVQKCPSYTQSDQKSRWPKLHDNHSNMHD